MAKSVTKQTASTISRKEGGDTTIFIILTKLQHYIRVIYIVMEVCLIMIRYIILAMRDLG